MAKNITKWEDYDEIVCPNGEIIDMQKLLDDQERAKAALIHLAPVFGGFINKLKFVYTFHVATQATDDRHIFVNPQFTNSLDLTGKVFVMAHEVMHCLLNHLRRSKGMDHEKANIAADYECNITLVDMGMFKFSTIEGLKAYIDKKYSGWGFEKIYADCNKSSNSSMSNEKQAGDAQKNRNKQKQQGGSGSGSGDQNKKPKSADYKAGWAQAIADWKAGKIKL